MLTRTTIEEAAEQLARASQVLLQSNDQEMVDEAAEMASQAVASIQD